MADDLPARLRALSRMRVHSGIAEEAASRIESLTAALQELVEVTEFAYMSAPKQPKEIAAARAALGDK